MLFWWRCSFVDQVERLPVPNGCNDSLYLVKNRNAFLNVCDLIKGWFLAIFMRIYVIRLEDIGHACYKLLRVPIKQ